MNHNTALSELRHHVGQTKNTLTQDEFSLLNVEQRALELRAAIAKSEKAIADMEASIKTLEKDQ